MPIIRKIEIANFRCLNRFVWHPIAGVNGLVGPGDSGKSTILDAIDYCLGARRNLAFVDTDFHCLDVSEPIRIEITIGSLDDPMKGIDTYGLYLRGYNRESGDIVEEPEANHETVLTMQLLVQADLEPQWSMISARAAAQGFTRNLVWADRVRLSPTRLGIYSEHNLSWRRGSILNKLSEERPDTSAALVAAAREVRTAFGEQAQEQLKEALAAVSEAAQSLGIPIGEVKALLDSHSVSITGGMISLHNEDGVPLKELGLGSARLLVAGLQRKVWANSPIALVDELEYGLEPHRIMRLIDALGAKEADPTFQVFITTHSPVAVRELSGDQLFILRKDAHSHAITRVRSDNDIQGTIRKFPEALLAPSILVCEGATEVGLIRGLDQQRVAEGEIAVAAHGVAIVDGGGDTTFGRANAFLKLGYRVAVVRDSDVEPRGDSKNEFFANGGAIFDWRENFALEDELFRSMPVSGIEGLLVSAIELKEEPTIDDNIKSASENQYDLDAIKIEIFSNDVSVDARAALATAAKAGKGWYKSVSAMEKVAREVIGPHLKDADDEFCDQIIAIFDWATNARRN